MPLVIAAVCFVVTALLATLAWRRVFPEVEVIVASADLPAGTQITAEQLTRMQIPSAALPPDPVAWESAVGKWVSVPILRGETLTHRRLQAAAPVAKDTISDGLLAIPVNGQYALGGKMRPGDKVTIMIVPKPDTKDKNAPTDPQATVLFRNVRVVDVRNSSGQSAAPADDKTKPQQAAPLGMPTTPGSGLPATVILDLTEAQALKLVAAVESKAAVYFYRESAGEG
ncbi:MAG: flagellar biosynthesis protein FlgA [Firmicutes bacterium]|nr:flagellar biosynthesis protein FlgA [Bacillota bacterium]